ncbi:type II secretion system F family protein [Tepidibacillus marianensis]|uniref:type II secretion system F family protein n=1 Tax=Tepidibacillus marianensis TaxID=3131995 RepID=UPI0030D312A3
MNKSLKLRSHWPEPLLIEFSQLMKVQIRNGIPFTQGVRLIKDVLPNKVTQDLNQFLHSLEQGESISNSLQQLQFPKTYLSFIVLGENHGDLGLAFEQCESYYQQRYQLKHSVRNAIAYPVFLLFLIIVLFFFFTTILLPQFLQLYQTLQVDVPYMTRIFLQAFHFIERYVLWIAAFWLLLALLIYSFLRNKSNRKKLKLWSFRIPVMKRYWLQKYTYFFSSNLSLFLNHGISLMTGVNILIHSSDVFVQETSQKIKDSLYEGKSLTEVLEQERLFLPSFIEMIRFYESVGSLDNGLAQYSDQLKKQMDLELKRRLKWLEPVLISLTGLFVFFLIYILFSPIFSLIQSI